jgi:hypothetical protein
MTTDTATTMDMATVIIMKEDITKKKAMGMDTDMTIVTVPSNNLISREECLNQPK